MVLEVEEVDLVGDEVDQHRDSGVSTLEVDCRLNEQRPVGDKGTVGWICYTCVLHAWSP